MVDTLVLETSEETRASSSLATRTISLKWGRGVMYCDYSSMVEPWIVVPVMRVQFPLVTPF